jgi:hypothetical protein
VRLPGTAGRPHLSVNSKEAVFGSGGTRGWKRTFHDPIPLPRGRQLVTLHDAAGYIMQLPKAEQDLPGGRRKLKRDM